MIGFEIAKLNDFDRDLQKKELKDFFSKFDFRTQLQIAVYASENLHKKIIEWGEILEKQNGPVA